MPTAVLPVLTFLNADERRARLHQALRVGELLARVLGEEVEVRPADGVDGVVETQPRRERVADADEPALVVLEVDRVGRVLEECPVTT